MDLHLDQKIGEIPTLTLLQASEDALRARAGSDCFEFGGSATEDRNRSQQSENRRGHVAEVECAVSDDRLHSQDRSLAEFAASLRASNPPVIGYIADNRFKLDLRTIFPGQDESVINAARAACMK